MNLHNTTLRRTIALAFFLMLGSLSNDAQAGIIILENSGTGNPDENVLFNGGPTNGVDNGPNTTITGITNTSGTLIDFTSSSLLKGTGGFGQATITAVVLDGQLNETQVLFGDILIAPSDGSFTFTDIEFNIIAGDDTPTGPQSTYVDALTIQVDGFDDLGNPVTFFSADNPFDLSENGSNKFRITSDDDWVMTSILLTTTPDVLEELKQVRILGDFGGDGDGPPGDGPTVVPEPSSIAVWSLMAILFCGYSYRRRR